ncbi:kinase-like domain-containing protein [Lenzites betulinus]|nr:kinase-like domain-containing protein [Lenzites betulinus]
MSEQPPSTNDPLLKTPSNRYLKELSEGECWWRAHYDWLLSRGYKLRPRYRPGWIPSWGPDENGALLDCEDWHSNILAAAMDAVRVSDQQQFVLKRISKTRHPEELNIAQYLSSEELMSDPRNHSVPLVEVFEVPDDEEYTIMVMPLFRRCNDPEWKTVGEVVAFVLQVLEGMQYMHKLHVAHRDSQLANIMFDPRPMYPRMFHPSDTYRTRDWKGAAKHSTRTAHPVRYYFIDFGLSVKFNLDDGPPRAHPIRGGDKTAPEILHWNGELLDPFPTDIYYLGNMLRMHVLQEFRGTEFLNPLVKDMVREDPKERPTIDEVVERFNSQILPTLTRKQLPTLYELSSPECWWRDHFDWLLSRGYMLRPRYKPGWKPSWKSDEKISVLRTKYEDWHDASLAVAMDAVRVSDQQQVVIKQISNTRHPDEVDIAQYLSSDELKSNPRNHSVPITEVFQVPDEEDVTLMVMPLFRSCNNPAWQTVGEVVSFVLQVLEGMQFMHQLKVAHRDAQLPNIMYDPRPMYPRMFHPRDTERARDWKGTAKHTTRTARPVRYYFIDFGLSVKFDSNESAPRAHPIRGGDKTAPEIVHWNGELLDPFPTDIYYLGNMLRMHVLQEFKGAEFLSPLVRDMVQEDPTERPTIDEVIQRFNSQVLPTLGRKQLRSRLAPIKEAEEEAFFRNIAHAFRTLGYRLTRKSPLPMPR